MRRWGRGAAVLVVVFCLLAPTGTRAHAATPNDSTQLTVTGGSLTGLTSNPMTISPAFDPATQDYVMRCVTGINFTQLTFTSASTIALGGASGLSLNVPVALGENQAVVITAPAPGNPTTTTQYWIRCLPHDFPVLQVNKAEGASAGWYMTGNISLATDGSDAGYAMVLDGNGTPVWYTATPGKAADVELLQPNVIAWAPVLFNNPAEAFQLYDLTSQTFSQVQSPTPPTDLHELFQAPDGSRYIISNPLRTGVDMTSLGAPFNTTNYVIDCLIQKFDQNGTLLWQWSEFDHTLLSEVQTYMASVNPYGSVQAADIYHCNSIDVDPTTGNVLVSARHEDAVYLISGAADGHVIWKMGGTPTTKDATAQYLAVTGDTYNGFSGQHDARFEPGGDISLYDDRSKVSGPARGIEYHIDTTAGTATLDWQYLSADGQGAPATGSFRRYNNGNNNLVGWGFRPNSGFTEVDATGNVLFDVTFPKGDKEYRVLRWDRSAIDANLLRNNAGLPRPASDLVNWMSLGGLAVGAPAATSTGPNREDVFIRGADNALWHRWWNGVTWTAWESFGGTLTSSPAAVAQGNQIDVFARGPDAALWHLNFNGSTWGTWTSLGGIIAGAPAATSWGPGRIDVFARGYDNMLYHISEVGTTWAAWDSLGVGLVNDPAATSWGVNRLDLFIEEADTNVYHMYWDGSSWKGPDAPGGLLTTSVGAATSAVGQLTIVGSGAGHLLQRANYTNGWMAWQPIGGFSSFAPSVVAHDASTQAVFVTGTDNSVYWGMLTTTVAGVFSI